MGEMTDRCPKSIGPKLLQVPAHLAQATKPKLVDFTEVDIIVCNVREKMKGRRKRPTYGGNDHSLLVGGYHETLENFSKGE